jgi:hypothetical protein
MSEGSAPVFRTKNRQLSARAIEILERERPMTLRQLFYRAISAGALQNSQLEYKRLGSIMTRLREANNVPRTWIVDHVRATLKPSSWSGLGDFGETVRDAYRKDFWSSLNHHVEVFVEKDAIAGTIQPVTKEFDIALRVCRGYASVSFAGEIADEWQRIEKPIFAYYLGDFDPSGFDLERDLREKLARYSGRWCVQSDIFDENRSWAKLTTGPGYTVDSDSFCWGRLAVQYADFHDHNLIPLPVKQKDRRARAFIERHGDECAEVDALPPSELRSRVRQAIESHIDQERWKRLQKTEELEKETLERVMKGWKKVI